MTTLVMVVGCTNSRRINDPFRGGEASGEGQIRIEVQNQNFNDASLHALRGGERVRLGDVGGKSDRQFTLRWNFSMDLQVEVDLVGGGTCRVDPLNADPGDRIWIRIPTELYATPCLAGKR